MRRGAARVVCASCLLREGVVRCERDASVGALAAHLRISAFDTYFIGLGIKPVSVRMSRKEVWLGT